MAEQASTSWKPVCKITDILPFSGVATQIENQQVAIFRLNNDDRVYAISNYDPFSHSYVLSRGLVGDKQGVIKVASPIYKQNFDLQTGQCLDDESIQLPIWDTRINDGVVEVSLEPKHPGKGVHIEH